MKKAFLSIVLVFVGLLMLMTFVAANKKEPFEAPINDEQPRNFTGPLQVFTSRPENPLAEIPGIEDHDNKDSVEHDMQDLKTMYTDMADKTTRESKDISKLPDFKSKTQYFSEFSLDDIKKTLDLGKTGSLRKPWNHMYSHSLNVAKLFESDVTKTIENILNDNINLREPTSNLILKFKIKSITLEGVASESSSNPYPAFYSKWSIVVHRDNKAYGFGFHAIFLHLGLDFEDIDTFFCHHENHTILFEDAIENISDLSVQYSSSSSGFSPWSL